MAGLIRQLRAQSLNEVWDCINAAAENGYAAEVEAMDPRQLALDIVEKTGSSTPIEYLDTAAYIIQFITRRPRSTRRECKHDYVLGVCIRCGVRQ